jgi:hypothetical protein
MRGFQVRQYLQIDEATSRFIELLKRNNFSVDCVLYYLTMLGGAMGVLCVVGKKRMYGIYVKNTRSGVVGKRLVCSKKLEETNEFDS